MLKDRIRQLISALYSSGQFVRNWSAIAILGTGVFAFLLCAYGIYESDCNNKCVFDRASNSAYESMQATLLSNPLNETDRKSNWAICSGRILAVIFTLLVAIEVILRLFRDSFRLLRLTWTPSDKVLVCGLGRIGFQKTMELLEQGKQVVVVELKESTQNTKLVEKAGAIIVQGDVTDALGMEEHICRWPQEIYLVTGHDHSNVTAMENIRMIRKEQTNAGKKPTPVTCYLHLYDNGLEQEVRRSQANQNKDSNRDDLIQIKVFNILSQAAKQLVRDFASKNIRPSAQDQVALYVIFGFGQMGKSLLREIAEQAHFENRKRSRVLVLTPDAEKECDDFLAKWGRLSPRTVLEDIAEAKFDPLCDAWGSRKARPLPPFQVDAEEAVEYVANVQFCEFSSSAISDSVVNELVRLAEGQGVCPAVAFCFDEGEVNFKLANQLNGVLQTAHGINSDLTHLEKLEEGKESPCQRLTEFHLPIFAFLPQNKALCEMFANSNDKYPVVPFGDAVSALVETFDPTVEEVAIEIARSYETNTNGNQYELDDYLPLWKRKDYWDRHSNLSAAEHAQLKLRLLGYTLAKGESSSSISIDEISLEQRAMLGLVEHNRWMAERLMTGWSYGPRSDQPPRRPSICDKSLLAAEELLKDYEQVEAVIKYWIEKGFHLEELAET